MAASKSRTSLWSGITLTAGASNIATSIIDLSAAYGAQLDIKLTNGGAGPTVPAQVQIQVGNDSVMTLVTILGTLIGSTVNSDVNYFSASIPLGTASVQLTAGSNTVQNVTVDADVSVVTGI